MRPWLVALRRVPERHLLLDQRNDAIEQRSRQRRHDNFGPDQRQVQFMGTSAHLVPAANP